MRTHPWQICCSLFSLLLFNKFQRNLAGIQRVLRPLMNNQQRIRLMNLPRSQFSMKADLPVGFPYRFNSSLIYNVNTLQNVKIRMSNVATERTMRKFNF